VLGGASADELLEEGDQDRGECGDGVSDRGVLEGVLGGADLAGVTPCCR
jgi:hypothetical protein